MSGTIGTALLVALDQAPVVLGPVTLVGHEVPSRIVIGGAQAVTIHRLPGGGRIIDAMGVDDGAIKWSGYFTGPIAATRARVVDAMRRSGEMVPLSFGDYAFNVVIVHFEYDLQDRGTLLSYRIQTQIVPDPSQQVNNTSVALLASLSNDIASATAALTGSGLTAAQSAITALSAAIAAPGSSPSPSTLTAANLALQSSGAALQGAIATNGAGLAAVELGPSPGISSGSALTAAVASAGTLATATQAAGYVNRSGSWLGQLGGQIQGEPLIFA